MCTHIHQLQTVQKNHPCKTKIYKVFKEQSLKNKQKNNQKKYAIQCKQMLCNLETMN